MYHKKMYDALFAIKELDPWKKFDSSMPFAIQIENGRVFYCFCEILTSGVRIIQCHYDNWGVEARRLENTEDVLFSDLPYRQNSFVIALAKKELLSEPELDAVDKYCKKMDIKVTRSFSYPMIRHARWMRLPWCFLTEEEEKDLTEAAESMIFFLSKLKRRRRISEMFSVDTQALTGTIPLVTTRRKMRCIDQTELPVGSNFSVPYPTWTGSTRELLANLDTAHNSGTWYADQFILPNTTDQELHNRQTMILSGEKPEAPRCQYGLFILNEKGEELVNCYTMTNMRGQMTAAFAEALKQHGCPEQIIVCSQRSYNFFYNLTNTMHIRLVQKMRCRTIEDFKTAILQDSSAGPMIPTAEAPDNTEIAKLFQNEDLLVQMEDSELMELFDLLRAVPDALPPETVQALCGYARKQGLEKCFEGIRFPAEKDEEKPVSETLPAAKKAAEEAEDGKAEEIRNEEPAAQTAGAAAHTAG